MMVAINAIRNMIHPNIIEPITNAISHQRGSVIHHQDQSITPTNFSTRKIKNKQVKRLIPFSIFLF